MKLTRLTYCSILFLAFALPCAGQLKLHSLLRDSMVLQRNDTISIWGWDKPFTKVAVDFNKQLVTTKSGADGKWLVKFPPMKHGGAFTMKIKGSKEIVLKDILIGDVWLCAGQSNMVHSLKLHRDRYRQEIAQANDPFIRQFTVPQQAELINEKEDYPGGKWISATSKDIADFSVVAYFFAKDIYEKHDIPIGLINASVGGTPIESWMNEEALKDFPSTSNILKRNKDTAYVNGINRMATVQNSMRPPEDDKGLKEKINWFDENYNAADWQILKLPGYWEDQGLQSLNGIVWFRKEVDLNEEFTNQPIRLSLGRIVDADEVFVNGKSVGKTTYQYPQRRYDLPAGILKPGKNIITVRITNYNGKGGFVPGKPYYLANKNDTIDLQGNWLFKIGDVFEQDMSWNGGLNIPNQPSALFNGMIAPITNFSIRGFVWYQGESNTHNAWQYGALLNKLISGWRAEWKTELPFLFVQLPNYGEVNYNSNQSAWAQLREEQRKSLSIPQTGMAVTIDLGEWNDIHPRNKKDVGKRLALLARQMVYDEKDIVASGPIIRSAIHKGNTIVASFYHTASGLMTIDGKAPNWLMIAGQDKKFLSANAKIENDKLIAWNEKISQPVYLKYAWADNPAGANLYNSRELPASPFEIKINIPVNNDSTRPWNNKKAAIVLTYDDALNVHLTNVLPVLDAAGLKATFYLYDYFGSFRAQIPTWKMAANRGHELGNHTMFHPCLGNIPGREWVNPDHDLSKYSLVRIQEEIQGMNNLLYSIDGKTQRTFAYPCGDKLVSDQAYIDPKNNSFIAARGVTSRLASIDNVNLFDIPAYGVNGQTGEELIKLVQQAIDEKKLLVFLFHGVGGEHDLNVSLKAHNELVSFLQSKQEEVWVAPMVEVASYIKTLNKNQQ